MYQKKKKKVSNEDWDVKCAKCRVSPKKTNSNSSCLASHKEEKQSCKEFEHDFTDIIILYKRACLLMKKIIVVFSVLLLHIFMQLFLCFSTEFKGL